MQAYWAPTNDMQNHAMEPFLGPQVLKYARFRNDEVKDSSEPAQHRPGLAAPIDNAASNIPSECPRR